MIADQTILAIIPARGQSKQLPRKNIRIVRDKHLIAYTIEAAKRSIFIDRLILSSDDMEIIQIAKSYGCETPFIRPKELANDNAPGILTVLHALKTLPEIYDLVILLQPTSPLRTTKDIDSCIFFFNSQQSSACVSVSGAVKSPFWHYYIEPQNSRLKPVINPQNINTPRQLLPQTYVLNGAIYLANVDWFVKTKSFIAEETIAYVMPRERSLDIDSEIDLQILETLLSKMNTSTRAGD